MKLPDKKWLVSSHDTSVQLTKPKLHSCQHNAIVEGYSLLDLGHAQINSLQLSIADSSAIILSGGALKKLK
jgi:hypothetical protein